MIKLNNFIENISYVETHYLGESSNPIGWQVICFDKNHNPLGGGLSSDLETAKRISVAEYCERLSFFNIVNSEELSSQFEIKNHPTTCGFAAGFEKEKVKLRSLAESIERWAWSKWIDDGFKLELINRIDHTNISSYLASHFESNVVYFKKIKINAPQVIEFLFVVFLGFKNGGVFPGSRVCALNENPFEHAIVEAYRHLKISETESGKMEFPYDRINFFSKNKDIALRQVDSAQNKNWPEFSVKLLKEYQTNVEGLYVFRSIGHNFIPWNEGKVNRFVY